MPVTQIRPNGTTVNVSITSSSGAGSAHVDLADNSDTTVTRGLANLGYCYLTMTDITLSAGQRVKQVRVGAKIARDLADVGAIERARIRVIDSISGTFGPADEFPAYSGVQTVVWRNWRTTAPNGSAWSEAIVDAMSLEVAWYASTGGLFLRISEAYVEVDANSQPVVTAPTVTGATTTTRPTLTSTFTDADGDAMVRGRWKVFTAAQYGASGFDPETASSTWDSGELSGQSVTTAVGKDLVNGVTYKAYFKAAQAWTGGTVWWSVWAGSSAFSVALVPPPQPTITVTPDLTLPAYRQRLSVGLPGLNLLTDVAAGFEGGIGTWVAVTNCAVAASSTNPKSGAGDLTMTASGAGTMTARSGAAASAKRVTPGASYSATVSFRSAVTARTVTAGITWFDVAGAVISTTFGTGAADTTSGYTTVTYTGAAPSNAFSAVVAAQVTSAAAAEVHRVDEAGLNVGTVTSWSAGGYAGNGTVLLERSQRISAGIGRGPARNWVHPQVYSAGALTTATDGFYSRQAGDSVVQRTLDRAAPESPSNVTAGMIEWQIRVGSFSYLDIGAPDGVATDGMHPYLFPAVPGLSFTASTWLWGSAAVTVRLGLIFVDAFNTQVGSTTLTSNTALTTTAQKLSVAATAPAGTVYARMVVEDTLAAVGLSVFTTQPKFRLTADPDEAWPGQTWAFTWEPVRSQPPIPVDGRVTVEAADHEAPPGRPIMYRATVNAFNAAGQAIASTPSVPVHVYSDLPASPILKDPFRPENAMVLLTRATDSIARTADSTVVHPLGRDGDPVKITAWQGGDDGKLHVETVGALELYRLKNLIGATAPLLLQHHDGGQTYLQPDPSTLDELSYGPTPFWAVEFGYVETRRPSV